MAGSRDAFGAAERERELMLTRVLEELAQVASSGRRADLVALHARCKYMLLAYDETAMREMGRIVSTLPVRPWEESIALYGGWLTAALNKPATIGGHANVLMHAFGHLSSQLTAAERAGYLDQLASFRDGRVSLESVRSPLRVWIARFDVQYLADQIYFQTDDGQAE
ncbi:MAG: YbgA family protein [Gemmatimonadetes bacterium]|nr:YbgA family protein [Gemmatimonadota bacterium]